jgi:hypothetical protein
MYFTFYITTLWWWVMFSWLFPICLRKLQVLEKKLIRKILTRSSGGRVAFFNTHWVEGWVDPRAGLEEKYFWLLLVFEPQLPGRQSRSVI